MIRPSSLVFPTARTLISWAQQLEPFHPTQFWVGYLYLHRVEALVDVERAEPVDDLSKLLLKAIDANPDKLQERLGMAPFLAQSMTASLSKRGWIGGDGRLTSSGSAALREGQWIKPARERQLLTFVERFAQPPGLIPFSPCSGTAWQPETHLDAGRIRAALADSKSGIALAGDGAPAWQQVLVQRPERWILAIIENAEGRLLGFPATLEGWALDVREPVLDLPAGLSDVFSEMLPRPDLERWRRSWLTWGREKGLPAADLSDCSLRLQGTALEIVAPVGWIERLRPIGNAWLQVGDGFLRAVRQIAWIPQDALNA